jgi:hypothetical protein
VSYRLLTEFENLFAGKAYRHRISNLGDFVAMHLYEDLVALNRSAKLSQRTASKEWVLNTANKRQGIQARRGDGTFGEIVPGEIALTDTGYQVSRGKVATVEIGVEVKILAKAMIKQIDRVISDLHKQVTEFKRGGGGSIPICVGIVGINYAPVYTSYEKERIYKTDGSGTYRHPLQEAAEAERRLIQYAKPAYDEFLTLRFAATNESPFPFTWMDLTETEQNYGSALVRVSREYDRRF